MNNKPFSYSEQKDLDYLLIQANALIGTPVVLDMKKLDKEQVLSSVFGDLKYKPKNQFRDGIYRLSGRKGSIEVRVNHESRTIKSIEIDLGGERGGILENNRNTLVIGDNSEAENLSQTVAALARTVLALQGKLDTLSTKNGLNDVRF